MSNPGFQPHDHSVCVSDAMATVEDHCATNSLKLTPVRRRVLEILLHEHKAMGAYEILDILSSEGMGSQPPVVYRALDFLGSNGFVHKIERLNAFVACGSPGKSHHPAFMICRGCTMVVEMESRPGVGLQETASDMGFSIEEVVVEAEGLCPKCRDAA